MLQADSVSSPPVPIGNFKFSQDASSRGKLQMKVVSSGSVLWQIERLSVRARRPHKITRVWHGIRVSTHGPLLWIWKLRKFPFHWRSKSLMHNNMSVLKNHWSDETTSTPINWINKIVTLEKVDVDYAWFAVIVHSVVRLYVNRRMTQTRYDHTYIDR